MAHACNPSAEGHKDRKSPEIHWALRLSESMSFRFIERICLKIIKAESYRDISSDSHSHEYICAYISAYTHVHVHTSKYIHYTYREAGGERNNLTERVRPALGRLR